jgi:hypothetical protein
VLIVAWCAVVKRKDDDITIINELPDEDSSLARLLSVLVGLIIIVLIAGLLFLAVRAFVVIVTLPWVVTGVQK